MENSVIFRPEEDYRSPSALSRFATIRSASYRARRLRGNDTRARSRYRDDLAARAAHVPAAVRTREIQAEYLVDEIVAQRLVEHLERAGFVIMKKPPATGSAALGRRFENP
jgi:hypothetical protein